MKPNDFKKMAILADQKKHAAKDKVYDTRLVESRKENHPTHSRNISEDSMIEAIDNKNTLIKLAKQIERLKSTKDVQGFIQDIAPHLALETVTMMLDPGTPSKVRAELLKDMLDRAGYGKVTKHAVARFDADTSKDAIISAIMGSKKDLGKAGIEIVDDDEDNTKGSGEADEG